MKKIEIQKCNFCDKIAEFTHNGKYLCNKHRMEKFPENRVIEFGNISSDPAKSKSFITPKNLPSKRKFFAGKHNSDILRQKKWDNLIGSVIIHNSPNRYFIKDNSGIPQMAVLENGNFYVLSGSQIIKVLPENSVEIIGTEEKIIQEKQERAKELEKIRKEKEMSEYQKIRRRISRIQEIKNGRETLKIFRMKIFKTQI